MGSLLFFFLMGSMLVIISKSLRILKNNCFIYRKKLPKFVTH
jgi:hypothetical protein